MFLGILHHYLSDFFTLPQKIGPLRMRVHPAYFRHRRKSHEAQRFSEAQIIAVLKEAEAGISVATL